MLSAEIFKAYDIRGVVGKTLTAEVVRQIGMALGALAAERGQRGIAVGRDGRLSGPELSAALMEGIAAMGLEALDLGCVPTPLTYFAAMHLGVNSCVSVTGSHNPPEYNGLKMVIAGETLALEKIGALKTRIERGLSPAGARGQIRREEIAEAYLARVLEGARLSRPVHIVVDCGNGVAGAVAPELFRRLGCTVTPLFCEVDGRFPNHHPDPSKPENLADLARVVRESDAELGLAFDGDGDRLGVVTKEGRMIYPDRLLMLFAADVLSRAPGGEIIYDVKCSRLLAPWIRARGGKPLMWNTGHALIKAKLKEMGAPLAGEMSGHFFFRERWYGFDDALYAGARLLEILSREAEIGAALAALPDSVSTPEINVAMREGEPHRLVARLREAGPFPGEESRLTLDGLRVEFSDGFGLARASNTTPVVVLRFEAESALALSRIQEIFRAALAALEPNLPLNF
ncbi:MAG: phosphomannomutase/phosphoglucomutase [Zoogloeaceae bacterium]|jgi:phosphomannomutase/phosphoglucomutase|nr:phosphomannomutase/phosphoglucomutase [Zoogloeaceae bacterium]